MHRVLRAISALLSVGLMVVGLLLIAEVVAGWLQPADDGLVLPWAAWRSQGEQLTWGGIPTLVSAGALVAVGLVLVLAAAATRRTDLPLAAPLPGVVATAAPRLLARRISDRLDASDGVGAAVVSVSRRRVKIKARGHGADLRKVVLDQVDGVLDELPLSYRPRVSISLAPAGSVR